MASPKTTSRIVRDVNSIVDGLISRQRTSATVAAQNVLAKNRDRQRIPGGVGIGGQSSGNIASPLTEVRRDLHTTPRLLQTTDGFFTFEIRDIEAIAFVDANGSDVVMVFARPPDTFT